MPRTITFDALIMGGANVRIDFSTEAVEIEVFYTLKASDANFIMTKSRRFIDPELNTQDKQDILRIANTLRQTLEQEELALP